MRTSARSRRISLVWATFYAGLIGFVVADTLAWATTVRAEESYAVPRAAFRLLVDRGGSAGTRGTLQPADADAAVQTVMDAFALLFEHRADYPRFDESIKNNLLEGVKIEPTVINREGLTFPFLVARTGEPGRVRLLISGSSLKEQGYLGHPDRLAPVLAREFQWVIAKADTKPKPKIISAPRELAHAPIRTNKEIRKMSGEERVQLLEQLFETYLRTVDDFASLENQPRYEPGTGNLVKPAQPDSTIRYYDIRVREALQRIVSEPSFLKETPNAVRSLLNGKIWNVTFAKIDRRDWATRTRVLPAEKAVVVGEAGRTIQPATILLNTYRKADPEDSFYADTSQLPMGALTTEQLALVIAKEIHHNIVEKSQAGHVAQDEMTAPE
ncbi:hypothetical protein YTPLAS18_31380 [Nitrospira sp.]|nr:hypothetical protein YTPLAS18_31380 [Nitrospira sp.]